MLSLALLIAAIWILVNYSRSRKQAGITGWVTTQDLDGQSRKIYRNKEAGVSCKPDVVLKDKVIEYKSAPGKGEPRWVDRLQVALQMLATGKKEGDLRYGNNERYSLRQDDPEMRAASKKALQIVEQMQRHLEQRTAPKATPSDKKCAKCSCQAICTDAVAAGNPNG